MGNLINKECKVCGSNFSVRKYREHTAFYCSRSCQAKSYIKRGKKDCEICGKEFEFIETRANSAKYCSRLCYHRSQIGKGLTEYTCFHCGVKFFDSASTNRKYCSKKCVNKQSKKIWKSGYQSQRKNMLRRGLIEKCNRCGYSEHIEILQVHHIDRNRKNNELSNLEVLCANCHFYEHRKHI